MCSAQEMRLPVMRNAASARRERERETEIDLRNLNTVESLHTLETEDGHCGEGVHYGEVEVNKVLREYNVTCCDQFMLTVTSPILSWIRRTIYAFCSST